MRSLGHLSAAVLVMTLSGCGENTNPEPGIEATRTPSELRIAVTGWSTIAIQVFACPGPVRVEPGERPVAVAGSYQCIDLGVGPPAETLNLVLSFDTLDQADRQLFDESRTWSVLVIENPAPEDRQGRFAIGEIAGGPIDQAPVPASAGPT